MPRVTRFPGFRSRSIAYGNASRALPIGRMSQKKLLSHTLSLPHSMRQSAQTNLRTPLTRPPWLNIPWQETNPFPELVEGNIPPQKHTCKKEFRSLHPQRSIKRPVEGNIPQKKHSCKKEFRSLSLSKGTFPQKKHSFKKEFRSLSPSKGTFPQKKHSFKKEFRSLSPSKGTFKKNVFVKQ